MLVYITWRSLWPTWAEESGRLRPKAGACQEAEAWSRQETSGQNKVRARKSGPLTTMGRREAQAPASPHSAGADRGLKEKKDSTLGRGVPPLLHSPVHSSNGDHPLRDPRASPLPAGWRSQVGGGQLGKSTLPEARPGACRRQCPCPWVWACSQDPEQAWQSAAEATEPQGRGGRGAGQTQPRESC